ncbi:hypothetical protein M3649_21215 [Ureibacillus chungkukjangi]|uniref:hypothetical protein n=1 Tax=Ureibacillus chungkukjangi TaxID=1202712 RepID=UPI002041E0D5|nr:hypothetical protein [Ureibacillus chungkukjangi]MCM3390607.1 hypothetical protein [Ureibacillus chungkukjangi]
MKAGKLVYFSLHSSALLSCKTHLYQNLADDLKEVIDTTEVDDSLNPILNYKDEDYQYSGIGDTFLDAELYLEKGRYRVKGYFKPGKEKSYSGFTIRLLPIEETYGLPIKHSTPHQPFSKYLRIQDSGKYNFNVECDDLKKWAFSFIPV